MKTNGALAAADVKLRIVSQVDTIQTRHNSSSIGDGIDALIVGGMRCLAMKDQVEDVPPASADCQAGRRGRFGNQTAEATF